MKLFDLNNTITDEYKVIKTCLDFLLRNGGAAIANGKHLVEEDGIYLNVTEYTTRLSENGKWEAHKKYADFQLVLTGEEFIHVSNIGKMKVGEYEPDRDYMQCFGEAETSHTLNENCGMLLMPTDAHMPCMSIDNKPSVVKKAVFKIPVQYFN